MEGAQNRKLLNSALTLVTSDLPPGTADTAQERKLPALETSSKNNAVPESPAARTGDLGRRQLSEPTKRKKGTFVVLPYPVIIL